MERSLTMAEVERKKAENMIIHKEEILNKPKKEWYSRKEQTKK